MSKKEAIPEAQGSVLFMSAIHILVGIYSLAFFALLDPTMFMLATIGALFLAAGLGIAVRNRFGLWLGALIFAPGMAEFYFAAQSSIASAGFSPSWQGALFNASLIIVMALLLLSAITLAKKRKHFA